MHNNKKPLQRNIKLIATNDLTQPPEMDSEMVESSWTNIGFFLYQLNLEVRRLGRRLERLHLILKKKQSAVFNQYIYIYIYIRNILFKKYVWMEFLCALYHRKFMLDYR